MKTSRSLSESPTLWSRVGTTRSCSFKPSPGLIPLISQLLNQRPSEFDVIIRAYNRHIQGNLPFDYCDVVANFYKRLFMETTDRDQKSMLLRRLIELGPTHNRWHVGDVVADVLESITDRSVAELAAELLREDEHYARWNKDYIGNRKLPESVARVFLNSIRGRMRRSRPKFPL